MKRNLFKKDEIILCTYIARFGRNEFDENSISRLKDRSVSSVKMKVQNIAAMLDEEGYTTHENVSKLSGKTTGEKGRKTNWDIVVNFLYQNKQELLGECLKIIQVE
jgi:hypothetical protein